MNMLVPIALAGAVAYVLYKKKQAAVPTPDQAGASELPPALQGAYSALLLNGTDPAAIDAVAQELDAVGYPKQAAALRAKSAQLRAGSAPTTFSGWQKYPPNRVRHATSKLLFSGGAVDTTAEGVAFRGTDKHRVFGAVSTLQPGISIGTNARPGSRAGRAYTPAIPVRATVTAPAGARLRAQPHSQSAVIGAVPRGASVHIKQHIRGDRTDVTSRGPGGSAYVRHDRIEGWMPSEWLQPIGGE